ncbi:MPPV-069 TGF-beta-like protein [Magpiepox virus 2]|nr:MPPV-069 TGF-beta-like protein [Magpiepox virus 2]
MESSYEVYILKAINSNFKRCCYPESMENISILYIDPNGNVKKESWLTVL